MTLGIRTSCKCKRLLYLYSKNNNDTSLKKHYKNYCRILTNKIKRTWNIIKKETNKYKRLNDTINHEDTPEAFNNYFLTISENITKNISSNGLINNTSNTPNYHSLNGPPRPFPNISFKNTSAKEIENIIKSLKTRESHGYDEITTKMLKISACPLY